MIQWCGFLPTPIHPLTKGFWSLYRSHYKHTSPQCQYFFQKKTSPPESGACWLLKKKRRSGEDADLLGARPPSATVYIQFHIYRLFFLSPFHPNLTTPPPRVNSNFLPQTLEYTLNYSLLVPQLVIHYPCYHLTNHLWNSTQNISESESPPPKKNYSRNSPKNERKLKSLNTPDWNSLKRTPT